MRFKVKILDKETNKRRWGLWYHVFSSDLDIGSELVRIIEFGADTHKEALDKTLKILKTSASKASRQTNYSIVLLPAEPLPGEEYVIADDELYRMKDKYSTAKQILKVKNPGECFVRGYGPEVAKALEEL